MVVQTTTTSRWLIYSKTWLKGDEGYDGSDEPVRDPKTVELFMSIANRLHDDDILFGSPRWLENFREMKQVAIDPLYKD